MTRPLLVLPVAIALALSVTSCCPVNPTLNTVKTAHGNTDWHIDTAEEFLTGKAMDGTVLAANHCPDTWTKTHMHVGLTNTNVYYYDHDVTATGADNDATSGIDNPMLFFYAGHGNPTLYNTLGNSATLPSMRLGNCTSGNHGSLRYFWQCSCEVFAHGPKSCTGSTEIYTCPGDFDGSHDSDAMRNVYERWGPVLDPTLRMACGSSSLAYCWESETNRIWDNYNNKGYDVADSFIDGLHRYSWNTPLCITTGGLFTGSTPLFDGTFTNAPNPSGPYYHIQYLSSFASTAPPILVHVPEMLAIYELIPLPLPDPYRRYKFSEQGEWMYSSEEVRGRGPAVKVNRNSGSVYVAGERRFDEKAPLLKDEEYIRAARRFLDEQGWTEKLAGEPSGMRMKIQTAAKEAKASRPMEVQKNVRVAFRRQMTVGEKAVPFVGEGGEMAIQLNNDGSVLNASKVWRQIKGVLKTTRGKPYDDAYREAMAKIQAKSAYKLKDWTWGYEEQSGNVRQTELKAVYLFNFMAAEPEKSLDFPPIVVKISAHVD